MSLPIENSECEAIENTDQSGDHDENDNFQETIGNVIQHAAEGVTVGAIKNAAQYAVKNGGRSSNVVSVFDKTVKSSLGNPKWFARVDMPHGNVPFHHINVNKAITGVKDPHIRISPGAAAAAGGAGQVLNVVNKAAPLLTVASVAYEAYQIKECLGKDIENHSSRNTIKRVTTTVAATAAGFTGSGIGATIGTVIFPGVGTLIGGLIGGVIGGIGGGVGSEISSEVILDTINYDIDYIICEKCQQEFQHRRYQEGYTQKLCPNCR
ncbi:hypothetical protein CAEBREN_04374 [Caenorhabditis brenneri]|uniref:Uncharacterized protein n=1 Tax=Caenorhabditis brenneri TaxID=135651 RepID=G0N3C1_CAEBE|nr:hypothetical protein CAEBREN_04374 [Caenorhabditis brenneri]